MMSLRILFVLLCASVAAAPPQEEEGFRPLFNGKDLSGWVPVNTAPSTWSLANTPAR